MLLISLVTASLLAFQPPLQPVVRPQQPLAVRPRVACGAIMMPPREWKEPPPKNAQEAALRAAEKKLEELNQPGSKAPTSWADMGLPEEAPPEPEIPALLAQAPLVLGGFSVLLFLLNGVGLFGEGPDIDKLAEEWSNL